MANASNVHSLAEFQQNAKEHARRLKESGQPEVLTIDGEAEFIVQSAEAYQKLLEAAELAEALPILRKSLEEARQGQCVPAQDVLREIREKLGIRDRA